MSHLIIQKADLYSSVKADVPGVETIVICTGKEQVEKDVYYLLPLFYEMSYINNLSFQPLEAEHERKVNTMTKMTRKQISSLLFAIMFFFLFLLSEVAMAEEPVSTLTFPSGLRIIEEEAFFGDTSLEDVILPEGIEKIGEMAFAHSSINRIILPKSLTSIADNAFLGCLSLQAEVYEGTYAQHACDQLNIPYTLIKPEGFGIWMQPESVFALENDWVTLTLKANATNYRWQYFNGEWIDVSFAGQGTDTLTFRFTSNLIAEANSWGEEKPTLWRCVVSDAEGHSETSEAVAVLPAPYFAVQPEDQSGNIGDTVVFTAAAAGRFQSLYWESSDDNGESWQRLSADNGIEESVSVFFGINTRGRLYRASMVDSFGNTYHSRTACVRTGDELFIQTQPVDQRARVGELVKFSLQARYAETYQWQISTDNGMSWHSFDASGANTDTVVVSVEEDSYDLLFRCEVSDEYNSIISNTVRVLKPEFTQSAGAYLILSEADNGVINDGIHVGDTAEFSAFSDVGQWSWNTYDVIVIGDDGVTITHPEETTSEVLQIVKTSETQSASTTHIRFEVKGMRQGRAILRGVSGDNTISYLIEVYGDRPVIVAQPSDFVGEVGEIAQFSVDVIGAKSYKWYFGEQDGYNSTKFRFPEMIGNRADCTVVVNNNRYFAQDSAVDHCDDYMVRCEIESLNGEIINSHSAYFYHTPRAYIDEDEIIVENYLDSYIVHFHSVSTVKEYAEYSFDNGITWNVEEEFERDYPHNFSFTLGKQFCPVLWRFRAIAPNGVSVCSNIVSVDYRNPVSITRQPEDQLVYIGETAHFEVAAENAESYWWQISFDGGIQWSYLGSYTQPSLDYTCYGYDYYLFRCAVTGTNGKKVYSQAVRMKRPDLSLTQPVDQIVSLGESATFNVHANATASYQWQTRTTGGAWTDIAGATQDSYTVKATSATLSKTEFRCIVKDKAGRTVTSLPARLIEKLQLTGQPEDQRLRVGDTAVFTVEASGVRQWQWYVSKDGGTTWENAAGSGADTHALSFTVEPAYFQYLWRCDLTGDGQQAWSNIVRVHPLMVITGQPQNTEAAIGGTALFYITADGAASYQWQVSVDSGKTWSNASGESTVSSYRYAVTDYNDYEKRWRCIITDNIGNQIVSDMVCIVEPTIRPIIHAQPISLYAPADTTAVFTVSATGVKQYQWQESYDGGVTWRNASDNGNRSEKLSVAVTETKWDTVLFRCLLTGSGGATIASNTVLVYQPVAIIEEPSDAEGRIGRTVTLHVRASGKVTYQWQQSDDNGLYWSECNGTYENGRAIDISVEEKHFDKSCWRCVVTGPLGDKTISRIVRISRAKVPVTGITLNLQKITLKPGTTQQLDATIEPKDATDQRLQWSSDNSLIASVNENGLVTAVSVGSTRIHADIGGISADCMITVADDFTMEFTEYTSEIWTNASTQGSLTVRLNGAVMPCKIEAYILTETGEAHRASYSKTINESEWSWTYEPITKPGTYTAVVKATDAEERIVTISSGTIAAKRQPVYRALMIYQDDWNEKGYMPWFRNDAYYMRELLYQNTYEGGAKYSVELSENQNKNGIRAAIQSTFSGVEDGDVSYIQIGCHGYSGGGGDLFIPAANSYAGKQAANTSANWISPSELRSWVQAYIPKGKVVIVLYSCGSGAMVYPYINDAKGVENFDATADAIIAEFREADRIERAADRTGELKESRYFVLTSSANKEVGAGWGGYGNWLAFWLSSGAGYKRSFSAPTSLGIRGQLEADTNGDGVVTIAEAYYYSKEQSVLFGNTYTWSDGTPAITHPKAYWSDAQFVLFHYSD